MSNLDDVLTVWVLAILSALVAVLVAVTVIAAMRGQL